MTYSEQIFVLIIKCFIRISIVPVISPHSKVVLRPIESHLYNNVGACLYFNQIFLKIDWCYLGSFIHITAFYFYFHFITWCIIHYILVLAEKSALSRSYPISPKTWHHNSLIRSPGNSIPAALGVSPTTWTNSLESHKFMHVPLTLQA